MRQSILLAVLCAGLARAAAAQPPSGQAQDILPLAPQRHYNGLVAGEEAYLANDARREAELGRQVNLNADMYWRWSGASSWYPGVFEAWPVVPGEIVGWQSGVSPPRVTPTSVPRAPRVPWSVSPAAAVLRPEARPKRAPLSVAPRSQPAPSEAAADANPGSGLLPGFAPQDEPATDVSKPGVAGQSAAPVRGPQPQVGAGPRAF